jgi:programmed cell death protein 5
MVLQQLLEPPALERLNNIRISSPDMFEQLVQLLVTLYQQGRISGKVSEEQLKSLVARVLEQKREPKITFERK